jgi:hypothetical protein
MRIAVVVIFAIGLIAPPDAGAAERSRITTFSLTPGEALPPRPRAKVETEILPAPVPPAAAAAAAAVAGPVPPPLTADALIGRWTERDPVYCVDERYTLEWTDDAMRVVFDGRPIDGSAVRYDSDGIGLKVVRVDRAGTTTGYWRLVRVDDDHVRLVETAERRSAAQAVVTTSDKLLVRCAAGGTPPAGLMARARLWWSGFVERLWPTNPPAPAPTS